MSYQVLARKWRPQRFDDVIGQRGVTQTLRNAIAANRIAQSFVFAGPRGVGKTTTARILARALNCINGPTADPCGECDACIEIAAGRDLDVVEIDAATNTQVDKVREVIISGLGVRPARDRYKIFIIDEVHRLSNNAFDALLKSIEEPPPHVVFMMATTEIEKVPATIQSRSQVFELKTIGLKQIADQLRTIAAAEQIDIDESALMLVARAGDGSMRDAQSSLDQVIAFAGQRIAADDVSTVLGLVRRDLLLDIADAVAAEDGAAMFVLAAQAVESGYELRSVVRELARLTRDLLIVKVDASRANDPEIAAEAERDRLRSIAAKFSQEDLMRAFDVLTKAEYDIRASANPRYHLEMALLRWVHLRKLVPLSELIQGLDNAGPASVSPGRTVGQSPAVSRTAPPPAAARPSAVPSRPGIASATVKAVEARREAVVAIQPVAAGEIKNAFLEEIRKAKKFFYGTVVAQAQRIDVEADRIVFVFAPQHRALRGQLDQTRAYLEELATRLSGRRMTVASDEGTPGTPSKPTADAVPSPPAGGAPSTGHGTPPALAGSEEGRRADLKQQALADSGVQAMLDVFAAEIKDVKER